MTCYHPMQGYRGKEITKTGKRKIVFNPSDAFCTSEPFQVTIPCNQCIGCRLERSRQWATRCMHEASLYQNNCFITLTYDDDHLPENGSLRYKDFQDFMKRLRWRAQGLEPVLRDGKTTYPIRFYMCSEYGERYGRPHYHAILFNYDFPDKQVLKRTGSGELIYRSSFLEELWSSGYSSIGNVTFDSAAYVARYIMKKATGDAAFHKYGKIDYDTGEYIHLEVEDNKMSRKPGIAKDWFDKYYEDVYNNDEVIIPRKKRNIQAKPPRYYDNQFEVIYPGDFELIKSKRKKNARKHADNQTFDRLLVREKCKLAQINNLCRNKEFTNDS